MIITAIITFMIQDISLQEIAFNYQRYHKTEQEGKKKTGTCRSIECKLYSIEPRTAVSAVT